MDRPGVIFAGAVISALGALTYNLLPLLLGTAQDFRGLNDQAMGVLGSSFYLGFTLSTATAYFWIRRFSWRAITFCAIPLAATALLLAGFAETYYAMLAAMVIAGSAFSLIYGIGTTVLGDTSRPARWFGLKIAAEAGLGAILLLILPGAVIAHWGFEGLMTAVATVLLLASPALLILPAQGTTRAQLNERMNETTDPRTISPTLRLALWLGLASVTAYLFSTTMIWAFVERIANGAGIDPVVTGNILSLGLILAMGGSLLAVAIGDRYGLAVPLSSSIAVLFVSILLLYGTGSPTAYLIAACLFTFSFGLGVPYMLAVVAQLDIDGRYVVLTVPAIGIGVMFAPAFGGLLTGVGGSAAMLLAGGLSVLVALALALTALRLGMPCALHVRENGQHGAL